MKKILLAPVAFGALLFSACGDGTTATTSSVVNLESTNYNTLATTASTLPQTTLVGATVPAGQATTEITEYTVQAGDVPFTVANRYGITVDALQLANVDTPGYGAFYVGLKIKIPAGAITPSSTVPTETTLSATPSETTTTLAGGGSNCAQGSYTIVEGDLPGTVAQKFDVTVDQLDAANVNTKGYTNFIVGVKIIIPASSASGCA
ncbi:MAG: LysM peptidoglycan-binding domain-containing protein [Actinobacteria bacterium]|nr:LysM peptidoglycan-binding domain-containing protein [Actinomycetota bacterium]